MKNKYQHNDDGTTTVFIESKTHGSKEVFVDTEEWDRVSVYRWSLSTPKKNGNCYAKTQINHPDGGWIFTNVVQGIGATVSWTRCMVLDDATVRADIILILTSLGGAPYMVDG